MMENLERNVLPLLTPPERYQILKEWNNTQTNFSKNATITALFEAQVEKTPDATALVYQDQHLSYCELNQKANQLAHYLQKQGVGPEGSVGICLNRSLDMVIGLLGVLKAGGAYIPLDPNYPPARLRYMIDDAAPHLLLTQTQLIVKLRLSDVPTIELDSQRSIIAGECTETPITKAAPHNLAYIIYTSGSTGKPKGVMIEHQALVNFTEAAGVKYEINSADRVLQFASISFDASVEEIYPCLTHGGTLVLRTDETVGTTETFLRYCREMALTVLDLPTSYWHQLVDSLAKTNVEFPEALRLVIIGGEKAQPGPLATWFNHAPPSIRLVNTYGPTEATVVATTYDLTAGKLFQNVPIGRPLNNVEAYILDKHLQPVPVGVPGELHLGGVGLARGYLNQTKLTSEKFISNPFNHNSDARLYKTGDLARYLHDGTIEFLGRTDNQVKIRGFRIELGEIETTLSQHPAVKEVVVLAREDAPGDKRLIAYITMTSPTAPTMGEWRYFLNQTLPHYMIPSAFIVLDKFPLNHSSKIDLKALPAPVLNRSSLDGDFAKPETEIEETLVNIWAKILKIEKVGIKDDFFDLGGDSILSIQIASEAGQAGLLFTPAQLFEYPTIAQLVPIVETKSRVKTEQEVVTGPLPVTPVQQRFLKQKSLKPHHSSQACLLEIHQPLDSFLLETAIHQLLVRHDSLRLRFTLDSAGWYQVTVSPSKAVPFFNIDLSTATDKEQQSTIESITEKLQTGFNLSVGPLINAAYFETRPQNPDYLLVIIHRLAVDDVSWRILLEDLEGLYQQLRHEDTAQLAPKTASYKHWTLQLAECAQSDDLQKELPFWLTTQAQQYVNLPVDYPHGNYVNGLALSHTISVSLNAESTRALLAEVPKAYQTQITDLLLTALTQAFYQWTGMATLLIEVHRDGRDTTLPGEDLSRTVGCFTIFYPVLLHLEDHSNAGEQLKSIKEQLRRIPNNGLGYGLLRYLSPDRETVNELLTTPQPQLSFRYRGQIDPILSETSLFKFTNTVCGSTRSLDGRERYLLEIEAGIVEEELQLSWKYSKNLHQRATIETLADNFLDALENLIAHCQSPEAGGYTPSDFPEADLSQQELDDLLSEISGI